MIGEKELLAASTGHIERSVGSGGIAQLIIDLGIDEDEFRSMFAALEGERCVDEMAKTKRHAYLVGFFDGFVIGVRAAREESLRGVLN